MQVQPTNLQPKLEKKAPIKAVLFDIYGTLLISASGDIDRDKLSSNALQRALKAGGVSLIKNTSGNEEKKLLSQLVTIVHKHKKASRHPYPEVDIQEVWRELLATAKLKGWVEYLQQEPDIPSLAFVFELYSNAVYPMPGALEMISWLNDKEIPVGIVSNAQFYTPLIMNYLLWEQFDGQEQIKGFDPDLSSYSYKLQRSKPDTYLFYHLKKQLAEKYDILPDETLFVGNDMLKDVYTGLKSGVQTALFAGDARSLRLRTDDKRVHGLQPDYIITHLNQLKDLF
ncbi:MAG: HAD hydrolase-like protein [Bacteroidales bacterium]